MYIKQIQLEREREREKDREQEGERARSPADLFILWQPGADVTLSASRLRLMGYDCVAIVWLPHFHIYN